MAYRTHGLAVSWHNSRRYLPALSTERSDESAVEWRKVGNFTPLADVQTPGSTQPRRAVARLHED